MVGKVVPDGTPEDEWKWVVEGLKEVYDHAQKCGVKMAIEPLNRFETYFLNIAADAAKLAADIHHPNIGILFDTFHANIEEKDVAQAYRTVGPYLKYGLGVVEACAAAGTDYVDLTGEVLFVRVEGDGSLNCHGYGSVVSVTATFGQCAAGWVFDQISSRALPKH